MIITKTENEASMILELDGRLDTTTSKQLEEEVTTSFKGKTEVIMDFSKLVYVSSAGLRVILSAQKIMNKQGSMKIINVNDMVMEVFEITGFSDILTIE
jgi:anti-sigma B factor antagonist